MKKILALALIVSLCLSACSGTGGESSTSNSSTSTSESLTSSSSVVEQSASSSDASASTSSTTEGALTLEEIKAIFSELDTKRNDMMKWLDKDYSKIPIDGIPIHKVDDVVVKLLYKLELDEPTPIYGTAVFAKVTEKMLPNFPWSSLNEIKNDILKIYISIPKSGVLEYMVTADINDVNCIFYEFNNNLYFRVISPADNHRIGKYIYWDYSTTKILQNESNKIIVEMCDIVNNTSVSCARRTLVKNGTGNWVLGANDWIS